MKAKKPTEKTTRKRTSDKFQEQTLRRAERDVVALVARNRGIAESPRSRSRHGDASAKRKPPHRDRAAERDRGGLLTRDRVRLEAEVTFLKKASADGARENRSEVRSDAPLLMRPF